MGVMEKLKVFVVQEPVVAASCLIAGVDVRTQTQVLTPDMKWTKQPSKEQDTSSMKRIQIIYNDPMPLIVRVTMMRNIMGNRIDQRVINALFQRLWLGLPFVNHLQRLCSIAIPMGDYLLILRSSMTVRKLKNPLSCIREFGIENQENMQRRFEIRFGRLEYGLALILLQRRLLLLFRKRGSSLIARSYCKRLRGATKKLQLSDKAKGECEGFHLKEKTKHECQGDDLSVESQNLSVDAAIEGGSYEETKSMFCHPSPSSVLEISSAAHLILD